MHAQSLSRVGLFVTSRTEPTRLLCPWDSPGKNTGMGCHALLQGIFPTQGSNPHLLCPLHWQAGSSLAPPGKPSVSRNGGDFISCLSPQPCQALALFQNGLSLGTSCIFHQISHITSKYVSQSLAVLFSREALIPEAEDHLYFLIISFLVKPSCLSSLACSKDQM